MSYTYLQGQEAVCSAASFSDIPACVLSRLNLTAEKSCSNDNATECCQGSQSGTMCEHSTESLGGEKSMSCAAGSRVRTLVAQEKGRELMGQSLDYGKKCAESLAKLDPLTSLWKTRQILLFGGGTRVSGDLASLGYMGHSGVLSAADAIWFNGTPCADHIRERMWFFAQDSDSYRMRKLQPKRNKQNKRGRFCDILQEIPDSKRGGLKKQWGPEILETDNAMSGSWWRAEPGVCRVANGVARRVDRLKAIGNGQVPAVVKLAWETLK